MNSSSDIVGGSPGEHCAEALAEGGLRVGLVERELGGGKCSYYACIPSKTLLRPGEAVRGAREAAATADVDVGEALAWRDFIVSDYADAGQEGWLADNGIDLLRGSGRLAGTGVVDVDDGEAPGPSHGVDVDEDGNGLLRDGSLYQLVREHDAVRERTLEITLLEPGAEAYSFSFG